MLEFRVLDSQKPAVVRRVWPETSLDDLLIALAFDEQVRVASIYREVIHVIRQVHTYLPDFSRKLVHELSRRLWEAGGDDGISIMGWIMEDIRDLYHPGKKKAEQAINFQDITPEGGLPRSAGV